MGAYKWDFIYNVVLCPFVYYFLLNAQTNSIELHFTMQINVPSANIINSKGLFYVWNWVVYQFLLEWKQETYF